MAAAHKSKRPRLAGPGNGLDVLASVEALGGSGERAPLLSFRFLEEPPRFCLLDSLFEVRLAVVDRAGAVKPGFETPFSLALRGEDKEDAAELEFADDAPRVLRASGVSAVRLRVRSASGRLPEGEVALVASQGSDAQAAVLGLVEAAQSRRFALVRYRLRFVEQPPDSWYKDEGGKDRCMVAVAQVEDATGAAVAQLSELPVRVTLLYEDEAEVGRQEILRIVSDADVAIGRDGRVRVPFRVQEVSKNHQGKGFRLRLAADPLLGIAPATSSPVLIRSKKNKRTSAAHRMLDDGSVGTGDGAADAAVAHNHASAASAAAPAAAGATLNDLAREHGEVGQSVATLASWAARVADHLRAIEWQRVGFEADGLQLAQSRPILRCPGCWAYADSARPQRHEPGCRLDAALRGYDAAVGAVQTLARFVRGRGARPPPSLSAGPAGGGEDDLQRGAATVAAATEWRLPDETRDEFIAPPVASMLGLSTPSHQHQHQQQQQQHQQQQLHAPPAPPPPLLSQAGGFSEEMQQPFFAPAAAASDPEAIGPEELQSVAAVVAQLQAQGFPCFGSGDELVGFYLYDDANQSVSFAPLAAFPAAQRETLARDAAGALATARQQQPHLVVTRAQCVTVEKMREQAVLNYLVQLQSFLS